MNIQTVYDPIAYNFPCVYKHKLRPTNRLYIYTYISWFCTFCRVIQRRMLTLYGVNIIPGRDQNCPGTCEMDGLWRAMRVRDAITYAIYGKCELNDTIYLYTTIVIKLISIIRD